MKRRRLYTILSIAIMLVMSMNLVISTLHSHEHFEWNHPENFADTGQCITVDSTVCPISAHLVTANIVAPSDVTQHFSSIGQVEFTDNDFLATNSFFPVLGRSPPFSG